MRSARAGIVTALLLVGAPPVEGAATPRCLGHAATITGGSRRIVRGTPGDDVITAYGDHYVVLAGGGDDLVCGDVTFDRLYGGPGHDRIHIPADARGASLGGPGDDRIRAPEGKADGGPGDDFVAADFVEGGPGDDTLVGLDFAILSFYGWRRGVTVDLLAETAAGQGRDRVTGVFSNVWGTRHDDVLLGSGGAEQLHAYRGRDRIDGRGGSDIVSGGLDDDVASGGGGRDDVDGDVGDDRIAGGRGRDTLWPGDGNDVVRAGPGDDTVSGKDGDDRLFGGAGHDGIHYVSWPADLRIDLDAGFAEGAGSDVVEGFEDAFGGDGSDLLRGDDGPNVLVAYSGDDTLEGLDADDVVEGRDGVDHANGGEGTDSCEAEVIIRCEPV